MTRYLWLGLGLSSVAAGAIGAVLPLLPTTPFLLLAAYCFARSSPRLQHWIETHPVAGPIIANWRRNGSIDRRTKRVALLFMAVAFLISLAFRVPLWALALQAAILMAVAFFLVTRPETPSP